MATIAPHQPGSALFPGVRCPFTKERIGDDTPGDGTDDVLRVVRDVTAQFSGNASKIVRDNVYDLPKTLFDEDNNGLFSQADEIRARAILTPIRPISGLPPAKAIRSCSTPSSLETTRSRSELHCRVKPRTAVGDGSFSAWHLPPQFLRRGPAATSLCRWLSQRRHLRTAGRSALLLGRDVVVVTEDVVRVVPAFHFSQPGVVVPVRGAHARLIIVEMIDVGPDEKGAIASQLLAGRRHVPLAIRAVRPLRKDVDVPLIAPRGEGRGAWC